MSDKEKKKKRIALLRKLLEPMRLLEKLSWDKRLNDLEGNRIFDAFDNLGKARDSVRQRL